MHFLANYNNNNVNTIAGVTNYEVNGHYAILNNRLQNGTTKFEVAELYTILVIIFLRKPVDVGGHLSGASNWNIQIERNLHINAETQMFEILKCMRVTCTK